MFSKTDFLLFPFYFHLITSPSHLYHTCAASCLSSPLLHPSVMPSCRLCHAIPPLPPCHPIVRSPPRLLARIVVPFQSPMPCHRNQEKPVDRGIDVHPARASTRSGWELICFSLHHVPAPMRSVFCGFAHGAWRSCPCLVEQRLERLREWVDKLHQTPSFSNASVVLG